MQLQSGQEQLITRYRKLSYVTIHPCFDSTQTMFLKEVVGVGVGVGVGRRVVGGGG